MAIDGSSLVANSGDQTLKGNSGPWKAGDQVLTVDTTKDNPEYICVEMADDHPAAIQRAAIATKDAAIATKDATIAANTAAIATKDTAIATKDAAIKNCGQAGTSLVDAMVFDISMTAAGTVETVDKAGFETNMRTYLGCKAPLCQVAIAVTAGSVNVVATVTDTTSTAVTAAKKLTTDSTAALSTALGVTVEAAPTVSAATKTTLTVAVAPPPPAPAAADDDNSAAGIVGGILGAVTFCLLVFVCYMASREKKNKPIFSAVLVDKIAPA